jgi:hypothetical protein
VAPVEKRTVRYEIALSKHLTNKKITDNLTIVTGYKKSLFQKQKDGAFNAGFVLSEIIHSYCVYMYPIT